MRQGCPPTQPTHHRSRARHGRVPLFPGWHGISWGTMVVKAFWVGGRPGSSGFLAGASKVYGWSRSSQVEVARLNGCSCFILWRITFDVWKWGRLRGFRPNGPWGPRPGALPLDPTKGAAFGMRFFWCLAGWGLRGRIRVRVGPILQGTNGPGSKGRRPWRVQGKAPGRGPQGPLGRKPRPVPLRTALRSPHPPAAGSSPPPAPEAAPASS